MTAKEACLSDDSLEYLSGFGNELSSEAIPGAVPLGRNNPRVAPYGLYTEQLSGTAFTAPRSRNRRTWLYRIQPIVVQHASRDLSQWLGKCDPATCQATVDPIRWDPIKEVKEYENQDFIDTFHLMAQAGSPKNRISIYQYHGRFAPTKRHLSNADGDWLIVPNMGTVKVFTELGRLIVAPREIVVVPRNIVFQLESDTVCSGYVLEVDSATGLELPERGPIGANGLANARDFLHPTAWCVRKNEYRNGSFEIYTKQEEKLYARTIDHSPFNVVGWHGNYLPYKYDLNRFCAVNSVTYDHMDPSIYTVLTCSSPIAGTALADFVIFPPRVLATDEETFRPPWFHRNCMSEYMGLIDGSYDAKEGGFVPGGASLHNLGTPHGPDAATHVKAVNDPCEAPVRMDQGMAFMFETYLPLKVSPGAMGRTQPKYLSCWHGLHDDFTGWDVIEP